MSWQSRYFGAQPAEIMGSADTYPFVVGARLRRRVIISHHLSVAPAPGTGLVD